MIDRLTMLQELSNLLDVDVNKLYVRPSFIKYYYGKSKEGFAWNWHCKVGLEDDSFQAKLNLNGVEDASYVITNIKKFIKSQTGENVTDNTAEQGIKLLNSYVDYLDNQLRPEVNHLNHSKI